MSEQRVVFLRKGLVGTCAFVALVLLASFYSIVSGAVDRAARQRLSAAEGAPTGAIAPPARAQSRGNALLARVGN
ncbi:MAG: hypothetical protein ABI520_04180 [Caldimonas sp.]